MDETALIAMGILVEETAKESLGETGDMVLVEGEEISDSERLPSMRHKRRMSRKRESSTMISSGDELENVVKRRRSKKPRLMSRMSDMDTEPDEIPRTERV